MNTANQMNNSITEIKKSFIDLLECVIEYKKQNEQWQKDRALLTQIEDLYQKELSDAETQRILEARDRLINETKRMHDKGQGHFGHNGRIDKVGGSLPSSSPTLSMIDDGLEAFGVRKGDVVKVFGLRKDVLLTHLINRLRDGDNWRGVFKGKEGYEQAKQTLQGLLDKGAPDDDKEAIKLRRGIARWDFIQGMAEKVENAGGVVEAKLELKEEVVDTNLDKPIVADITEPKKTDEPKIEPDTKKRNTNQKGNLYAKSGEVTINRDFNTFSNNPSVIFSKRVISDIDTALPEKDEVVNSIKKFVKNDLGYHAEERMKEVDTILGHFDKADAEGLKNTIEAHETVADGFFSFMRGYDRPNSWYVFQNINNVADMYSTFNLYDNDGKTKYGFKYKKVGNKQARGTIMNCLAKQRFVEAIDKELQKENPDYKGFMSILDPNENLIEPRAVLDNDRVKELIKKWEQKDGYKGLGEAINIIMDEYEARESVYNPFLLGAEQHFRSEMHIKIDEGHAYEEASPFYPENCMRNMDVYIKDLVNKDGLYYDEHLADALNYDSVKSLVASLGMLAMEDDLKFNEYTENVYNKIKKESNVSMNSKITRDEESVKKADEFMNAFEKRQIGIVLPSQAELDKKITDNYKQSVMKAIAENSGVSKERIRAGIEYDLKSDLIKETSSSLGYWLGITDDKNDVVSYDKIYQACKNTNDKNISKTIFEIGDKLDEYSIYKDEESTGSLGSFSNVAMAFDFGMQVKNNFDKLNKAKETVKNVLSKNSNFGGENTDELASQIVTNGFMSHVFGKQNGAKMPDKFSFDMVKKGLDDNFEKGDKSALATICYNAFKDAGIVDGKTGVMTTSQNRLFEGYKKAAGYSDISNNFVNTAVKLTNDETNYQKSEAAAIENIKKMYPSLSNVEELIKGQKLTETAKPKDRGLYGKNIDAVTKWREHLSQFADKTTGSDGYVWTGDDMNYLVSAMTMGGGNYNDIKEYDQFGSQSFMNSIVANSPNTEVPLYRFENMLNGYRNYDLKVGDTVQFDSQHFTWSDDFAMNSASDWFGEGAPVLFRVNGKKPFYNFEQRVGKGFSSSRGNYQCKGIVEYEGSVAGNCKITGQSKMTLPNGNEAIVYDCEYDYTSRDTFTNLNLKQFAYLNEMYGKEDENGKKG